MMETGPFPKVKAGLAWDMTITCFWESTRGRSGGGQSVRMEKKQADGL